MPRNSRSAPLARDRVGDGGRLGVGEVAVAAARDHAAAGSGRRICRDIRVQHLRAGAEQVDREVRRARPRPSRRMNRSMPATRSGSGAPQEPAGPHHRLAVGQQQVAAGDARRAGAGSRRMLDDLGGVDHADLDLLAPSATASRQRCTVSSMRQRVERESEAAPGSVVRSAIASLTGGPCRPSRPGRQPGVEQPAELVRAGTRGRPRPAAAAGRAGQLQPGPDAGGGGPRAPRTALRGLAAVDLAPRPVRVSSEHQRPRRPRVPSTASASPRRIASGPSRCRRPRRRSSSAIGAIACWCTL